ncbi:MAG TPA: DNA ligase D [Nitrososphaeraceae archaeon]|nr:DNA ligase D [Nitrososphaeraceae archaeon]
MILEKYNEKRNFHRTSEPKGYQKKYEYNKASRFVVQKHNASRLHYDFRLEDKLEGVLKSWAVPKEISVDPKIKRLAVLTEDHPLDYLHFEGLIPEGEYGGGSVTVWDRGTFISESDISEQFKKGKITFVLSGQKLKGKFYLVRMNLQNEKEGRHWLLMKAPDVFEPNEDLTMTKSGSVLSGILKTKKKKQDKRKQKDVQQQKETFQSKKLPFKIRVKSGGPYQKMLANRNNQLHNFSTIKPMLSTLVNRPFNNKEWVFEIKWDGVRSIMFIDNTKEIVQLQSRSGNIITHRYPEIVRALKSPVSIKSLTQSVVRCKSAVLDGEIVVLDNKTGLPSFQNHQRRMNLDHEKDIENLSRQIPGTYYLFDILYLDGTNVQNLSFLQRRKILSQIVNENTRIKISDFIEEIGEEVYKTTKSMGLEGLVAKNKSSKYVQGKRSSDWLKIKHIRTQDCVIIGYNKGEGTREKYFGSLLLAVRDIEGQFQFVGHTGSGFDSISLAQIYEKVQNLRTEKCAIDYVPYTNREPIWVKPEIVAEIKFSDWTRDNIMKSPIFLRLREDKKPEECFIEKERYTKKVIDTRIKERSNQNAKVNIMNTANNSHNDFNNHAYSYFSNLDKVYWNKTSTHRQFTKKDLIEYYDKISKYILPYLKDRPLSLSRYPDGIKGKSFYQKNWDQNKPSFVQTVKIYSKSEDEGVINYVLCNNKETLLWLANLGCIEIHPWYSRITDFDEGVEEDNALLYPEKCSLNFPDFIIFDLDPYIFLNVQDNVTNQKEPEYSLKGFKATAEVALGLKELFDELKIQSYVKTSGKTGLHILVPIDNLYTYDQTRSFARVIGSSMSRRYPNKITMEWDTSKRNGKVFFDYNQNSKGKTIASIFSARPVESAAVSFPVNWVDLLDVDPTDFMLLNVPDILESNTHNPWSNLMENKQNLNEILEKASHVL